MITLNKKTKEKIYVVAQNIDHLKGKYFVSAVVVAENEEQAINRAEDYLNGFGEDVIFDRSRVKAFEVGVLTKRPKAVGTNQSNLPYTECFALEIGEDYEF